ncbi:MAG: tetratricopeptide repeat protein [Planctomycetota bacterium]
MAALIRIAELLLDGKRASRALALLGEAARLEQRLSVDRERAARLAARRHHATASALRLLGRGYEADAEERQSWLALSLLPDEELLPLRFAVALARGVDAASNGRGGEALDWHARASDLARRLGDRPGELAAVSALATDLVGLGRVDDALHHYQRALDLAQELGDLASARGLARQALAALDTDDPRRARFEAALSPSDGGQDP